jgi:biopolymer transport protein ExbB
MAIKSLGASAILALATTASGALADETNQSHLSGDDPRRSEMTLADRTPGAEGSADHLFPPVVQEVGKGLLAWYLGTPPADRVTSGGMAACAVLGLGVVLERLVRLRRRKVVPPAFTARFLDRLHDGRVDCGQALDHCELNPSPAARVALAAVRRWGRPAADLERAVALAHRVETDGLKRNVGTLRRIAVLAPLLGLLGTLFALGRALERVPDAAAPRASAVVSVTDAAVPAGMPLSLGSALAGALTPLSAGIVIAIAALIAYDGLLVRIEKLAGSLDRLGAETIDAIAMAAPVSLPTITLASAARRPSATKFDAGIESGGSARGPHHGYFRAAEAADPARRSGDPEIGF